MMIYAQKVKREGLTVDTNLSRLVLKPIILFSLLSGLAGTVQAAAYIKYDGIDGESQDSDHKGWSDLESLSQALHQPRGGATGQSRRRGGVVVEDLQLEVKIDSATTQLYSAASQGRVLGSVEIELCEGPPSLPCDQGKERTQHCYLKYELTNVMVTSFQINASGNDERGTAAIALNFEDIEQNYDPSEHQCSIEH
jgi:type VI secretion system secreted protein Hcp